MPDLTQQQISVPTAYGSFPRSFTLPSSVDPGLSTNYDNGVLKIKAKKAEPKPKQIKISVGSEKTLEAKAPSRAS